MAISENTGGTQSATVTTEHTLATITVAGTYQLVVDTSNMVAGDVLELRIKVKARSASSSAEVFYAAYSHDQGNDVIKISPPVPAPHEFVATLKQTAGTSRNFEWAIYKYGGVSAYEEVLLGTATATSGGTTTLSVDSIPDTYDDLRFVAFISAHTGASDSLRMRVGNGTADTGSNYDWAMAFGGNSTNDSSGTGATSWQDGSGMGPSSSTPTGFDTWEGRIYKYADTAANRRMHSKGLANRSTSVSYHYTFTGEWVNTADAIDVVEIFLASADFKEGSELRVYGVTYGGT